MWQTTLHLLVIQLCSTSFGLGNEQRVVVTEGSDAVLPCSVRDRDLTYQLFDWRKDDQQEVFLYDAGIHYNNDRGGQDPQFKGRVSHFEDELKHGNASIKIRNTKVEDRGDYSCIFPRFQSQIFHIKLIVAALKPHITILNVTEEGVHLQCHVSSASSEPTVKWQDGNGNILHAEEPQVSEVKGRFSVTLLTTVTSSGHFRCVVTQKEIQHQVYSEIYVYVRGDKAAPEPHITILKGELLEQVLEEGVYLLCHVPSASPKPTVEWQDGSGNILHAEEPQVSEVKGRFSVTLLTTVTSSGRFRCVVTQEEIQHQVYSEIYVYVRGKLDCLSNITVFISVLAAVLVGLVVVMCVLKVCKIKGSLAKWRKDVLKWKSALRM